MKKCSPRWNSKRCLGVMFGILVLGLLLDYCAYPYLVRPPIGVSPNRGENGLWLRYTWYFGADTDTAQLAKRLQAEQIRYAYFHVRDVQANGILHFHKLAPAETLSTALHRQAPSVRLLAWVYIGNPAYSSRSTQCPFCLRHSRR